MELYQIYNPITATPFISNEHYMEIEPCHALKPYVKCFWGTIKPVNQLNNNLVERVVTPDTCMDIIFNVDFSKNKINNIFSGIDDRSFRTNNQYDKNINFTFAIRFYAWSVVLFSEESMANTHNTSFEVGYHFAKIKSEIEPLLFYVVDMHELIPIVEKVLMKHYHAEHGTPLVFEAIEKILKNKGNLLTERLSKEVHISNRQLERLFREYVGISPKNFSTMVRYQYVWNDILFSPYFNVLDAVHKYGYSDQSHLHHDFKKFHSMSIMEAKRYALKDAIKDVAFIQE